MRGSGEAARRFRQGRPLLVGESPEALQLFQPRRWVLAQDAQVSDQLGAGIARARPQPRQIALQQAKQLFEPPLRDVMRLDVDRDAGPGAQRLQLDFLQPDGE